MATIPQKIMIDRIAFFTMHPLALEPAAELMILQVRCV